MLSPLIRLLPLLPLALALPTTQPTPFGPLISPRQTVTNCTAASAFHIIAARGSTEPQGEGPLQDVSALIEAAVPGSDDIGVVYPATLLPYDSSEEAGVLNMTLMIQQYVASCPDSRIVLLGYSQVSQHD